MYDQLLIFYFTGTGNAYAAANWITQVAKQQKIKCVVKKITASTEVKREDVSEKTLIGFCYPTHGFNAPPVVVDFCLRFPKMKNRMFLLNTRAGMKLYKLFTPGLSGLAQLLPALILRTKGLKIVGYQPMDLPSNWIAVHPGLRRKVVDSVFERCKRKTETFATTILKGKNVYKGWLSFPFDILVSPISVAYYFFGRFALTKSFIADANCTNCGLCITECPVNAIKMKNGAPFWTSKCESCMHCMNVCPQRAIQTPHLFVVVFWWLAFSVIPIFLTKRFAQPGSYVDRHFALFVDLFVLGTALPVLFFSYRLLHFFMKFKFFNQLIRFTSLTKFSFWRRYMAPKFLKNGNIS